MKLHLKWLLPLLATLLIVALAVRGVTQRRAEQARAAAPRAPVALELAPSDVVTAARLEVVRTLEVSGTIEAVRTAMVKAKVAGEVRELHVREGDAVRAGQVVATLDATEYAARLRQAQQQAESARAQLEIAERTLQNNRALVEQGFISRNALDTSVSNAAAARANLLAAQAAADVARKAMDDAVLRAPIAGSVSQRLVQPGERVGVDGRIVEIVDLRELELEAAVPPDQVGAVRVGAKATLRVDGVDAAVTARVARINPSTQAGTRAVPVYLAVAPHEGLRHGLFATGRIELDRQAGIAVPESAVRLDEARPYVLLVQGEQVVRRAVELGPRGEVGGRAVRIVRSGLAEGDRVLAGTVGIVREGTRVKLTPVIGASAAGH
ncbi:efflux RND transporter periplasmic adaptor subunit [Caldimonas aquatica]|uniref:Efflux RND transporter periplasmic adaptor subunit n=1 Tax=Caldimonas aquatica TaxID=376175 RepID=A0ABY6MVN2_9BURK|nr:efflux RND transporter periplasmic adaptor subunit [Schlegelella aquatica]UZD56059.1 efflux RND transporter periplasmic adaptor subunit [Schlegelella aquatica]